MLFLFTIFIASNVQLKLGTIMKKLTGKKYERWRNHYRMDIIKETLMELSSIHIFAD